MKTICGLAIGVVLGIFVIQMHNVVVKCADLVQFYGELDRHEQKEIKEIIGNLCSSVPNYLED